MNYLLGIDLGTSSLKTLLVDPEARVLSSASMEYPIHIPSPGAAEQDPGDWYRAAAATVREVMEAARVSTKKIAGIGLSGQMHGLVALDESGNPLRPAIIWADQRSSGQVGQVYERIGAERLAEWTGNPLSVGFMLASWLWLREHEPDTAKKARWLLLPKDYLRFRLTGEIGTEPSDASSTSLFDIRKLGWCLPLLEELDISPNILPPVHTSQEIAGELMDLAAAETGLPAGTPVIFGGADQAMAALGRGVVEPGLLSCSISTGGQLVMPLRAPSYDPRLRLHCYAHALPGLWYLMAATLSAGMSLRWLRDQVARDFSYGELADLAQDAGNSGGLLFLPHLIGERTPYMDPSSKAAFVGLTASHSLPHMVRAVMEGVIYSLRLGMETIKQVGAPVGRVLASGGGTRHPLWLSLMADIFNCPVEAAEVPDASALGAALLAGLGVGIIEHPEDVPNLSRKSEKNIIQPNAGRAQIYEDGYVKFKALYPALKPFRF